MVWSLAEQDPEHYVQQVLHKADRRLARHGVDRNDVHLDRRRPPGLTVPDEAEEPDEPPKQTDKFVATSKWAEMNKDRQAGLVLLGVGATVAGVATPLTAFVWPGLAALITVGVILLILALIFSLAGLGTERKTWLETKG